MNIFIKLLPIILVSIIFYLLLYNIYPKYKELISLAKKFNELKNKEKEMNALEKLTQALSQKPNIQQLINNKEILDLWLPQEPKIEDILASLVGIYSANNIVFKGTDFNIDKQPKIYNQNVLPVKVISFNLSAELGSNNLMNFINAIEQNIRLMNIKKAKISSSGPSDFTVESYSLSEK
jgi:hypothetical protein